MADGESDLDCKGGSQLTVSRNGFQFSVNVMVVGKLGCEVLAGMPFLYENGIFIDFVSESIQVKEALSIPFGNRVSNLAVPHYVC